jgi:hypothetical protein
VNGKSCSLTAPAGRLRASAQGVQIGRVTDAIILGRTAECLLGASGWTVPRQFILWRDDSGGVGARRVPQNARSSHR